MPVAAISNDSYYSHHEPSQLYLGFLGDWTNPKTLHIESFLPQDDELIKEAETCLIEILPKSQAYVQLQT